MNFRQLLGPACAMAFAVAFAIPGAASAADTKQPVDPALKQAIENATLYVPSMKGAVHFHNGSAEKRVSLTGLGLHPWVEHATSYTYINEIFPNTSKPRAWHAPDAAAVTVTSGTLSANASFIDVIAVRHVHGKIVQAAHHHIYGLVQNVEFTGRSMKVTYLTLGPNDARCCPTVVKQITLQYTGAGELKEVPTR